MTNEPCQHVNFIGYILLRLALVLPKFLLNFEIHLLVLFPKATILVLELTITKQIPTLVSIQKDLTSKKSKNGPKRKDCQTPVPLSIQRSIHHCKGLRMGLDAKEWNPGECIAYPSQNPYILEDDVLNQSQTWDDRNETDQPKLQSR